MPKRKFGGRKNDICENQENDQDVIETAKHPKNVWILVVFGVNTINYSSLMTILPNMSV